MSILKFFQENKAQVATPVIAGLVAWAQHGLAGAPADGSFTWAAFMAGAVGGSLLYNGGKMLLNSELCKKATENFDLGPTWEELDNQPKVK